MTGSWLSLAFLDWRTRLLRIASGSSSSELSGVRAFSLPFRLREGEIVVSFMITGWSGGAGGECSLVGIFVIWVGRGSVGVLEEGMGEVRV